MIDYELPTSVVVGTQKLEIRSDFRPILDICVCMQDESLTDFEKSIAALKIFYTARLLPDESEALEKCARFVSGPNSMDSPKVCGNDSKLVDWEQDFPLLIAPINKVAGVDIRSLPYLHWWTFLAYFQEIGECLFSQIVAIRRKRARGKKLEDYEKEFARENAHLIRFGCSSAISEDMLDLIRQNHLRNGGLANG
jgi:hypothetical protein